MLKAGRNSTDMGRSFLSTYWKYGIAFATWNVDRQDIWTNLNYLARRKNRPIQVSIPGKGKFFEAGDLT